MCCLDCRSSCFGGVIELFRPCVVEAEDSGGLGGGGGGGGGGGEEIAGEAKRERGWTEGGGRGEGGRERELELSSRIWSVWTE